jgi:hypothetical protein
MQARLRRVVPEAWPTGIFRRFAMELSGPLVAAGSALQSRLGRRPGGVALASYALLTVALAFPLIGRLTSAVPSDAADPVLNTWILWWNSQTLPLTQDWWNAPAFHPHRGVLTFSEHLLGLTPISTPINWLTGSPVVAYNVTFLLTFVLSGWTAYLLGLELTGRRDAAWLAGIAYAFAPYRMSRLAHLQVLASFWMPLALVGLHRYARDGRLRWLVVFGVATFMQGLSNSYFLLYFPVLVGLWAVWFSRTAGWWRQVGAIGASGVLAMLPLLPILLTYADSHGAQGLSRSMEEVGLLSADLTGLLSAAPHLSVWGSLSLFQNPEQQLFPGLTVVMLLGAASWRMRGCRTADAASPVLRVARAVLRTLLAVLVSVLIVRLVAGPWVVEPLGVRISVNRLDKLFPQLFLLALAAALLSPLGVAAWRRRSKTAFYLLAAVLLGLCAMGPYPAIAGTSVMADSPYLLLMELPGFDALRVPARFWMLVLVCLSALVALAYARLMPPGRRRGAAVLAVLTAGMLADGWVRLPTVPAPARSPLLEASASGPVLELPLGWRDDDAAAMLRGAGHGQPVVNGYSGYAPAYYGAVLHAFADGRTSRMLRELVRLGALRHVRIDRTRPDAERIERAVARVPEGRLEAASDTEAVYTFVPMPVAGPRTVQVGEQLRVADATANRFEYLVHFTADGELGTRWTGGPQAPGQQLRLDLGTPRRVGAVVLWGSGNMDFPRLLHVDVSLDGDDWNTVWQGPTEVETLNAALRDPGVPLTVAFPEEIARYVRLRQMGTDSTFHWSLTEVAVHAP